MRSLTAMQARRRQSTAVCTSTRCAHSHPLTGSSWNGRTDVFDPQHLLDNLRKSPSTPIPHLLNATFHAVDTQLSALSAAEGSHSGCTAVTCLLRLEDEEGNPVGEGSGVAPHVVGGTKGKLEGHAGEAAKAAEAVGIDPTEGKPGSGEGQHPNGELAFSLLCGVG